MGRIRAIPPFVASGVPPDVEGVRPAARNPVRFIAQALRVMVASHIRNRFPPARTPRLYVRPEARRHGAVRGRAQLIYDQEWEA